MAQKKLKSKSLRKINYSSNQVISQVLALLTKHYKHTPEEEQMELLLNLKNNYKDYLEDEVWGNVAKSFEPEIELKPKEEIKLLKDDQSFNVYGRKHIASNAYQQMELAMRLPISVQGALMPDAHQGYGLPIGGVLATKDAVIPYGVGLDIGCRMALTVYDEKASFLDRYSYQIEQALKSKTNFGTGGELNFTQEHKVLDRSEFESTELLRRLKGKAVKQLGTSGSGNHFVEFGLVQLHEDNDLELPAGEYVGLLSHSGSRGLGATVAKHYTDIAKSTCLLPRQAGHLAWLDLNSEAGQEYWMSMNLAGDYAKACHDRIHINLAKELGIEPIAKVENHHNFAWMQVNAQGEELVVHRKGATPAGKGELGIIPGSMTANGYIVSGKGNPGSLLSASHGAGRRLSRKGARESYTGSEMRKVLNREKVKLIGGGIDEAPIAYKDIDEVMLSQTELVEVIGKFLPRIVRMDKN